MAGECIDYAEREGGVLRSRQLAALTIRALNLATTTLNWACIGWWVGFRGQPPETGTLA